MNEFKRGISTSGTLVEDENGLFW